MMILPSHRMSEQDLFLPSFHAQYGYKNKVCAADVIASCEAYLEALVRTSSCVFS